MMIVEDKANNTYVNVETIDGNIKTKEQITLDLKSMVNSLDNFNNQGKIITIRKKSGAFRTIFSPSPALKSRLQLLLPNLNKLQLELSDSEIVHGFIPHKSPVTNAKKHVGLQFTLNFDLANFFDTVTPQMVEDLIPNHERYFVNNRAYQGLPTSPAVCNIAAIKLDREIKNSIKQMNYKCVYTRYADDLTFSFNDYELYNRLKYWVPLTIQNCGFILNEKKTRLQNAKFGNRIITGISVGAEKINVPRGTKRKIKVAEYLKQHSRLKGLNEWSKLKLPKNPLDHTLLVIKEIVNFIRKKSIIQGVRPENIILNEKKDKLEEIKGNLQILKQNYGITNNNIRQFDQIVKRRKYV